MTGPDAMASPGTREVSLVSLINMVLRRRALVVWSALIVAFVFTGMLLIGPRSWTTTASFFPQGKRAGGNLSALAAQFGVPVGTGDANESPSFYADLVKSRAILSTVIDSGVTVPSRGKVDLAQEYRINDSTRALRREMAIRKLGDHVGVATNVKTGVVTMRVSSESAELSASISKRLLELLNKFNLETRRGQASAERKFTEDRLALVRKDLRAAEDAKQGFLQLNRVIESPQLQFQQDRLERGIREQFELYTNLLKAYEQAKIDEVRDTPVITVVERPEPAARPDSRGVAARGIASLIAGFVLGAALALLLESFSAPANERNAEQDEFQRLGRATLRDLLRPWRLLRSIKA